ncbi:uncharacterized protein LOC105217119 [Zeugodacus cucurbitae]|uniref:Uncharacterized protein n=1 Tax=Zeugodacus cucurbitae TaxID=28588 RepID=A0A0A1XAH5_ZEUCU|nr:uncharacterized protein LOC105217119 [Zeugodacus cucurbitae]
MFRYLNFTTTPKTIVIVLVLFSISTTRAIDRASTSAAVTSKPDQSTSLGSGSSRQTDGYIKRNIKVNDLSTSSSAAAKSYDTPPEFYRGPGSTSKTSSSASSSTSASIDTPYHNRDSVTASFISKPVTFPDLTGHKKYHNNDPSQQLANSFNSWQQLRGQSAQDRISVKPYGSNEVHGLTSGYAPGGGGGHYSHHDIRPYTTGGHYIDYGPTHTGGHYGTSGHSGYYGGANSAEAGAIPFDVYGGKGSGHYAGHGGEYSYTYPEVPHETAAHKGHHDLSQKALLAKSFLIPLASAAVLGIAAALVSNPLLLQLGTVSALPVGATVVGKRRRRDLRTLQAVKAGLAPSSELPKSAKKAAGGADMAYRAQHLRTKARV